MMNENRKNCTMAAVSFALTLAAALLSSQALAIQPGPDDRWKSRATSVPFRLNARAKTSSRSDLAAFLSRYRTMGSVLLQSFNTDKSGFMLFIR